MAARRSFFFIGSPSTLYSVVCLAVCKGFFVLFGCLAPTLAQAQDDSDEVYTTNFRPGHNLSFLVTIQQSRWKLNVTPEVPNVDRKAVLPGLALRYAFHLALARKFGLVMGTGVQFLYDAKNYEGYTPGSVIGFPSILIGFVQNFASDWRLMFCGEYYASWFPKMSATNTAGTQAQLGGIPDNLSVFAEIDSFSKKTVALSGVIGYRLVALDFLGKSRTDSFLFRLNPRDSGWFVQTGATWQLGDELGR